MDEGESQTLSLTLSCGGFSRDISQKVSWKHFLHLRVTDVGGHVTCLFMSSKPFHGNTCSEICLLFCKKSRISSEVPIKVFHTTLVVLRLGSPMTEKCVSGAGKRRKHLGHLRHDGAGRSETQSRHPFTQVMPQFPSQRVWTV